MNRKLLVVLTVFFSCFLFNTAFARDLGQMGRSYEIIEQDLIEMIKGMLYQKQQSGELDTFHRNLKNDAINYVKRPPGYLLPRATVYREFAIDPTYTLDRDIADADGNIIFPMGYTFNPLDIKPLTKTYCFIDGDDSEQLVWLDNTCPDAINYKRILVNGDFNHINTTSAAKVYFDQGKFLTSTFRIEALPAVVRQNGPYLYVQELDI